MPGAVQHPPLRGDVLRRAAAEAVADGAQAERRAVVGTPVPHRVHGAGGPVAQHADLAAADARQQHAPLVQVAGGADVVPLAHTVTGPIRDANSSAALSCMTVSRHASGSRRIIWPGSSKSQCG